MDGALRHVVRYFSRSPAWTLVSVLCLAMAAVWVTLLLGMTRSLLDRSSRIPHAESLAIVSLVSRTGDMRPVDPLRFYEWQRSARSFEQMSAQVTGVLSLEMEPVCGAGGRVNAGVVTWNHLSLLGLEPMLGRTFREDDDVPGAAPLVALSSTIWRECFDSRQDIVGATVRLNRRLYTVIGVLSDRVYPGVARLWVTQPLAVSEVLNVPLKITSYFTVWGRLKPGIRPAQARSELEALTSAGSAEAAGEDTRPAVTTVTEYIMRPHQGALRLMSLGSGAVLAICCGNVSIILLLRTVSRRKEFALRYSLGARRADVVKLLLLEGGALALVAAAMGAALVPVAARSLPLVDPAGFDFATIPIDAGLLAISLGIAAACVGLATVAPVYLAWNRDCAEILKEDSTGATTGVRGSRMRAFLVAGQLAVTVALLILTALLTKSAMVILTDYLGFAPGHALIAKQVLIGPRLADTAGQQQYMDRVVERLRATPGVARAGSVTFFPVGDSHYPVRIAAAGKGKELAADLVAVAGDYFAAAGIPIVKGRAFGNADRPNGPAVAVIDSGLASRLGNDVIGKVVNIEGSDREIVGVCGAVRFRGLDQAAAPLAYVPLGQSRIAFPFVTFVMRTVVNPGSLVRPVREAIESGGEAGVQDILPVSEVLNGVLLRQTFARRMLGVLAVIGFLLSLAGLSAIAACAVSQRQREAGIRMALGAGGWDVGVTVLSQPLLTGAVGIAAGAGLGAALSRAVGGLLFGVTALDPWIYIAVPGVTLGAMLLAAALQMRRITSVPVSDLLRS